MVIGKNGVPEVALVTDITGVVSEVVVTDIAEVAMVTGPGATDFKTSRCY